MRNRILAIVGLALLAAVSASAQIPQTADVNVPFDFQAGDWHMPAGTYHISRPGTLLFSLRGPGNVSAYVVTHRETAKTVADQGYLLFHEIGGHYYLGGIWSAGSADGMECFPGKAEKEALKSSNPRPSFTTLALSTVPAR